MPRRTIEPAAMQRMFEYDPITGALTRRGTGKNAVCMRRDGAKAKLMPHVCLSRVYVRATHIIYALVNKTMPDGVRTQFVDGNPANLKRINLVFTSNREGAPGELRPSPAILKALKALGGRATAAQVREATGLTQPMGTYMALLERARKVHLVGTDNGALVWELGPGPGGRPMVLAELRAKPPTDELEPEDIEAREHARALAHEALEQARHGVIPNSVFALGAAA